MRKHWFPGRGNVVGEYGGGADFGISLAPSINITNTVEYSGNLASNSWNTLTNILSAGGNVTVVDSGAAMLPKRFYRVHLVVNTQH